MSLPSFFPSPLSQCASYRLTKFFVGNVPRFASPKDLMKYFARFGPVTDFHTPATGRHRGFRFVNRFDPLCLLSTLHVYGGYRMVVKEAKTKTVRVKEREILIIFCRGRHRERESAGN